jgi:hypothetical protein
MKNKSKNWIKSEIVKAITLKELSKEELISILEFIQNKNE